MTYISMFFTWLSELFSTFSAFFVGILRTFRFTDVLDIFLVAYLIYKAIGWIRETRAAQLIKGIFLVVLFFALAKMLNLKTIDMLLSNIVNTGIVVVVVLFQPEIRSALERFGRTKVSGFSLFSSGTSNEEYAQLENAIDHIATAAGNLSKTKTGALIVCEKATKLGDHIATGVVVDALVSVELLGNIFFRNSPLHDGAVVIRDGRVLAASCFLPKPSKEEYIARELGSRHRAAIGVSEISDSVTVVVSEETGQISIAERGKLTRDYNRQTLKMELRKKLLPDLSEKEKKEEKQSVGRSNTHGKKED